MAGVTDGFAVDEPVLVVRRRQRLLFVGEQAFAVALHLVAGETERVVLDWWMPYDRFPAESSTGSATTATSRTIRPTAAR